MNEQITAYLESLRKQFNVSRQLRDGTPVTGFTPEEELAIVEFINIYSDQRRGGEGRLATFVVFPPEANPYTTIMLGWWSLLMAEADASNKALVWVTATGAMQAKAEMHAVRLSHLQSVEYVTWGDLVRIANSKPALLQQLIVIGDVDFEPGNNVQQLLSGDGSIRHDAILAAVTKMLNNPQFSFALFHRTGWNPAFDPSTMFVP